MMLVVLCHAVSGIIIGRNNLSVMIGSVSYSKNPFWAKRIPGMHYSEEGNSLPIHYSYGERRLILPFNEQVTKYSTTESIITKKHFNQLKLYASVNAYLRFYLGTTSQRVQFTNQKDNDVFEIATSFTILVDNSRDVANPFFTVEASNYQTISPETKISFTFDWRFHSAPSIPHTATVAKVPILVGIGIFVIAVILSTIFVTKRKKAQESVVPQSEIFRFSPLFHNDLLIISAGLLFVVCGIFITRFCYNKKEIGLHLQNVMLLLLVAPVQLSALIGRTLQQRLDDTSYCSISLFYYMIMILPVTGFNIISGFFGSFRGFRIRRLVLSEPFMLLVSMAISRGWGNSGSLIDPFFTIDPTIGASNFPLKPRPFYCHALNVVYVLACVVILRPACLHMCDVFYNDAPLDYGLLWASLVVYGSVASLCGVVRTWYRTGRFSTHWTDGHILYHAFVAIGGAGVMLVEVFNRSGIFFTTDLKSFIQVYGFAMVLGWALIGVIMCVGAFFSYVWSFVIVLMGHAQRKSS